MGPRGYLSASHSTTALESFTTSTLALKRDPGSESMKTDVEKAINSLDVPRKDSRKLIPTLTDLEWILESHSSSSPSLIRTTLNFLERICLENEELRLFLRDKTGLLRICVDFLAKNYSSNTLKMAELLKYLVFGWKVRRSEAPRLNRLISQLMRLILDKDKELMIPSVFILACLCRNNSSVTKTLLSEEELAYFFIQKQSDPKLQVLIHILNYHLNQTANDDKLLFDRSPKAVGMDLKGCVFRISDAFCSAYTDDDALMMRLLIDFWVCLTEDAEHDGKAIDNLDILSVSKTVAFVAEFGDGSNPFSNECMFSFFRCLLCRYKNRIEAFEFAIKLFLPRLESLNRGSLKEAISFFGDVIRSLGDEVEEATKVNVDQMYLVIEKLTEILLSKEGRLLEDRQAALETLHSISKADFNWCELVSTKISNPIEFTISLVSCLFLDSELCVSVFLTELISFCKNFNDVEWKKASEEVILSNDKVNKALLNCIKESCHSHVHEDIIKILASKPIGSLRSYEKGLDVPDLSNVDFYRLLPKTYEDKIESAVCSINRAIESKVLENLSAADVFELGNFRVYSADRKCEILQRSLNSAEDTIESQKKLNVLLDSQVEKLSFTMGKLLDRDDQRKAEVQRLKREFEETQSKAKNFKEELSTALNEKVKEHEELQAQYEKLTTKAIKYKEDIDTLQKTIKEHHRVQGELQEKLKVEKKLNTDMAATLEKREEKLRKKERQLDDEIHYRHKAEKELEALKKDYASHQALTKRQLEKKDKQLVEQTEEINTMKQIQDQIFNLSKLRGQKN